MDKSKIKDYCVVGAHSTIDLQNVVKLWMKEGWQVLQVYIHYVVIAFMDVLLRLLHRLMCVATWPEAVAVFFELHFKQWAHHLVHRLL